MSKWDDEFDAQWQQIEAKAKATRAAEQEANRAAEKAAEKAAEDAAAALIAEEEAEKAARERKRLGRKVKKQAKHACAAALVASTASVAPSIADERLSQLPPNKPFAAKSLPPPVEEGASPPQSPPTAPTRVLSLGGTPVDTAPASSLSTPTLAAVEHLATERVSLVTAALAVVGQRHPAVLARVPHRVSTRAWSAPASRAVSPRPQHVSRLALPSPSVSPSGGSFRAETLVELPLAGRRRISNGSEASAPTAADGIRLAATAECTPDEERERSLRRRREHAAAMGALHALGSAADAGALRLCIAAAEPHVHALPALEEELQVARLRLQTLGVGADKVASPSPSVSVPVSGPSVTVGVASVGVETSVAGSRLGASLATICELADHASPSHDSADHEWQVRTPSVVVPLAELRAATANFDASTKVGEGGFASVYRAAHIPSLPGVADVAIKKHHVTALPAWRGARGTPPQSTLSAVCAGSSLSANQSPDFHDLQREVMLLQRCSHAHLLPLLGHCLERTAPCLLFPLCVGGSLQARLQPTSVEHWTSLQRLGFSSVPPPLSWRQRLQIMHEACEALVYLHTPTNVKPRIVHRDVKVRRTALLRPTRGQIVAPIDRRAYRPSPAVALATDPQLACDPCTQPANILLDADLHARLADTGTTRTHAARPRPAAPAGHPSATPLRGPTLRHPGSHGYASPSLLATAACLPRRAVWPRFRVRQGDAARRRAAHPERRAGRVLHAGLRRPDRDQRGRVLRDHRRLRGGHDPARLPHQSLPDRDDRPLRGRVRPRVGRDHRPPDRRQHHVASRSRQRSQGSVLRRTRPHVAVRRPTAQPILH